MPEKGFREQALVALIPAYGAIAVLFMGVGRIKAVRGLRAAILFYALFALLFFSCLFSFVLTMLLVEMPWQGMTAFAVVGGAIILWGLGYAEIGIEAAFLHGRTETDSVENDRSN